MLTVRAAALSEYGLVRFLGAQHAAAMSEGRPVQARSMGMHHLRILEMHHPIVKAADGVHVML